MNTHRPQLVAKRVINITVREREEEEEARAKEAAEKLQSDRLAAARMAAQLEEERKAAAEALKKPEFKLPAWMLGPPDTSATSSSTAAWPWANVCGVCEEPANLACVDCGTAYCYQRCGTSGGEHRRLAQPVPQRQVPCYFLRGHEGWGGCTIRSLKCLDGTAHRPSHEGHQLDTFVLLSVCLTDCSIHLHFMQKSILQYPLLDVFGTHGRGRM